MTLPPTPLLSVVIPTRDAGPYLLGCLRSLQQQPPSPDEMEIIVVANGAAEAALTRLTDEFPRVRLIEFPTPQGFSKPANAGWRATQAPLILLLNDDTVCEAGCITALLSVAEQQPDMAFFAALMVCHDAPGVVNSAGHQLMPHGMVVDRGSGLPVNLFAQPGEVFGACGGAALYRRDLLEELEGFDEDLWIVAEDADLDFRARLAGYRCGFIPQAVVRHRVSESLGAGSPALSYYYLRNVVLCQLKNLPPTFMRRHRRAVYWQLWKVMAAVIREGKAASLRTALRDLPRLAPLMLAKRQRQWRRLQQRGAEIVAWAAREEAAVGRPAQAPLPGRLWRNVLSALRALPALLCVLWWFARLDRQDRQLARRRPEHDPSGCAENGP